VTSALLRRAAQRWRAIDRLLPEPGLGAADCGADLVITGPDGQVIADGRCEHWAGAPGSLELSWGAPRQFRLTPVIGGPDVGGALGALLGRWPDHLAGVAGAGNAGTAAVVSWPSRDVDGVKALLRHGLDPLEVLAVRRAAVPVPVPVPVPAGGGPGRVTIRRAGPGDAETVARLGLELIRFDARLGAVNERPDTLDALRAEAAGLLAGPEPWTWLAERDGSAAGMLAGQRPEAAGGVAPLVRAAPAAYLELMFVDPGARGAGVGTALTAEFHRAVTAAGAAVTLLHYEQLNPLSAPFWNGHGYRPLWTSWQAAPAAVIR
jgi:GNAT superfamily N-acetyltransferase